MVAFRNYMHLIWRMYKIRKIQFEFKRRLNRQLTYLYMVVLSIVIIYPLLITVLSAFVRECQCLYT